MTTPTTPAPDDELRQALTTALEECRTLIPSAMAEALLPLVAARADGIHRGQA